MAGGVKETDPVELANRCDRFMRGTKKLYESGPNNGDMWFFELYYHLQDCADALRKLNRATLPTAHGTDSGGATT